MCVSECLYYIAVKNLISETYRQLIRSVSASECEPHRVLSFFRLLFKTKSNQFPKKKQQKNDGNTISK